MGSRGEIMRGKSHNLPQYAHTIRSYSIIIRFYNSTNISLDSLPARVRPRIMREMGESGEEWGNGEDWEWGVEGTVSFGRVT